MDLSQISTQGIPSYQIPPESPQPTPNLSSQKPPESPQPTQSGKRKERRKTSTTNPANSPGPSSSNSVMNRTLSSENGFIVGENQELSRAIQNDRVEEKLTALMNMVANMDRTLRGLQTHMAILTNEVNPSRSRESSSTYEPKRYDDVQEFDAFCVKLQEDREFKN